MAVAEVALDRQVADLRGTERVTRLIAIYGGNTAERANAEECVDLDAAPVALPAHRFYPPLDESRPTLSETIGQAREVAIVNRI